MELEAAVQAIADAGGVTVAEAAALMSERADAIAAVIFAEDEADAATLSAVTSAEVTALSAQVTELLGRIDAVELSARAARVDAAIEAGILLSNAREAYIKLSDDQLDKKLELARSAPAVPRGGYQGRPQGIKTEAIELSAMSDEQRTHYDIARKHLRDHDKTMAHLRSRGIITA